MASSEFNKGFAWCFFVGVGWMYLQGRRIAQLDNGGGDGDPQLQAAPGTTNIRATQAQQQVMRQKAKHRAM